MAISPNLNRVPTVTDPRDTAPVAKTSTDPSIVAPKPNDMMVAVQPRTPSTKPLTGSPNTSHRTTIDQSTGDLVYHIIDTRSGQQVAQSPDEAMLRMRAYAKQMTSNTQSDTPGPTTQTKG